MSTRSARYWLLVITPLVIALVPSSVVWAAQTGGVPEINKKLNELQEIVGSLSKELEQAQTDLASTKADLAATKTNLATTQADLASARNEMTSAYASLQGQLDDLNPSLDLYTESSRGTGDVAFETLARQVEGALWETLLLKRILGETLDSGDAATAALAKLRDAQAMFSQAAENDLVVALGISGEWTEAAGRIDGILKDAESALESNGEVDTLQTQADMLGEVEATQESLRNRRQIAQTSFQNFDQKSNQLYNLLSQVVKSINEMMRAFTKNML